ncbi:MAG: glycosyltransferase family 9 protein [Verrucomicrobia bacterium]|nr:glycosyltransferase family 9 protein [Verrucomicrobiota bacterium]MDE3100369.1 glycosyltransferase family 9 protein [Verrucomicrobiota bacterium]
MNILIVKPTSLGDVIQALPVLRLLKLHRPEARVFWWIDSALAPLLEDDPDLAGLVLFHRRRWANPLYWHEALASIHATRARQFDLVIDLQCLARSGAFAWLANGKFLAGLDEPREGARGFYDIAVPRQSFHTHAVDWYLAVLSALRVPIDRKFTWLPARPAARSQVREQARAAAGETGASGPTPRWIALQPGARWPNKRWPASSFARLASLLLREFPDARLAVLGDAADREIAAAICRPEPSRALNLCGRLSLPQMIEWLRLADLMITNDTGPMHVAAALGTPVIALFGPTEPRRTGPYGQLHGVLRVELPCSPCLKPRCAWKNPVECLTAIPPESVLQAARKKLSSSPLRP